MENDDGIHSHCSSCFLMTCNHAECPVVPCINGCGTRYHKCKEEDHLQEICSEQEVACINNQYGCPDRILRRQQGQHLSVCPASIVICTHTWNRWPLSCRRYNQLQYFNHGQLDYELVLRDQRMEEKLTSLPRRVKVQLRNFLTKRHPEVPIPSYTNYNIREKGDRSVPDRQYMTDIDGNVVVDVVMKQYMKQQLEQEKAWKRDLTERMAGENIFSIQTEATKLQREGIHNHCRTCVITDCSIGKMFDPSRWRESCPIIDCRWGCGARYHHCKSQDHSFLCKFYKESDEMDWLRRLQIKSDEESMDKEDTTFAENKYIVTAGAHTNSVPEASGTLQEPTHLDINIETIHRMHVKPVNIRSFICGKIFRRDEIQQHIINTHQEIIPGLGSGWIISRCPLAYLGCPFSVDNLAPNSEDFRIKFSRDDDNFCCRLKEVLPSSKCNKKSSLNVLPMEIIFYISDYLDPISLRALSLCSRRMRDICWSLVRTRGCVTPVWEKQRARGQRRHRTGWVEVSRRWFFSTGMGAVTRWVNINIGRMQQHLQECPFNEQNTVARNPNTREHRQLQEELKRKVRKKVH